MRNLQRSFVKGYTFGLALTLLFAWPGAWRANAQTSARANPNQPSMAAGQAREELSITPRSLPACPPAGIPPLKDSDNRTGHHKVVLRWNANAETGNQQTATVGYCLYRSESQTSAKQNAVCDLCEQINAVPVAGTACTDHIVKDSTTYYYVVVGINASGKIGASSGEVTAPIPAEAERGTLPANSPLPDLCRKPSP